jgi:hypothetical protein
VLRRQGGAAEEQHGTGADRERGECLTGRASRVDGGGKRRPVRRRYSAGVGAGRGQQRLCWRQRPATAGSAVACCVGGGRDT